MTTATKPKPKPAKPVDLSEYAEESVPFDTVIRQIIKAKPMHRTAKPRPAAAPRKRK